MLSSASWQGNNFSPVKLSFWGDSWVTLALLTFMNCPGQFCRFTPCPSSSSSQEHMQSAFLERDLKLMKWPQKECGELVDCWGKWPSHSKVPSSSSVSFYQGKGNSVGISRWLEGEAGSKIKLSYVLEIYLYQWTCFVHAPRQEISFSSGFHWNNLSRYC